MLDVENTLKALPLIIDNEFLLKYARLVERHGRTPIVHHVTNKHHIVPKSWYKLHNLPVDNSLRNLVNLPYREHVLAHYYLCLCTEDPLKYANQLALVCLISRNKLNHVDKLLLENLPLYYNIYEDFISKRKSNYKLYKRDNE